MSFGSSSYGAYPWAAFGAGAPTSAASISAPVPAIAAQVVDGDTVRDSDGDLVSADDPIAEEVAFYITTIAGHFFGDPAIGNGVVRVQSRTKTSQVAIRDLVTRALRPMVERGDITNIRVTPTPVVQNGLAINYYSVTYEKTDAVRR